MNNANALKNLNSSEILDLNGLDLDTVMKIYILIINNQENRLVEFLNTKKIHYNYSHLKSKGLNLFHTLTYYQLSSLIELTNNKDILNEIIRFVTFYIVKYNNFDSNKKSQLTELLTKSAIRLGGLEEKLEHLEGTFVNEISNWKEEIEKLMKQNQT